MAGTTADRELIAASPAVAEFALATPADEAAVRALLRRSVMPGAVRVAFTREPDYGAGEGLAGAEDRTVICRHSGRLVGVGRCSTHTLHRNGAACRIAYLGELRLSQDAPHAAKILRDGYAFLRATLASHDADGYFTSVAADNHRARLVLEHGQRLGLPAYTFLADLVTLLVPVPRWSHTAATDDGSGHTDDRAELTAFLERHAHTAHLTPTWDDARWRALAVHGITSRDFCVIRRRGDIVAAAALWDQRRFRQIVIDGYAGPLRWSRPLVDAMQRVLARPGLPAPGAVLAQAAVLGAAVADASAWPALWRALHARAAAIRVSWLALLRDARDPRMPVLRRYLGAQTYRTRLYEVRWPEMPAWSDSWDARPFSPEVALL